MNHFPRLTDAAPMPQQSGATASRETPLVLVVESSPYLSATIGELCDFLRIRVELVHNPAHLAERLTDQPIAVLVHAGANSSRQSDDATRPDVIDVLAEVARHDPGLPVLLVTDKPENRLASLEQGEAPRVLANLHWLASSPGIRPLVEFLFMAERRHGIPGLVPL